jgi:hypothetical protein
MGYPREYALPSPLSATAFGDPRQQRFFTDAPPQLSEGMPGPAARGVRDPRLCRDGVVDGGVGRGRSGGGGGVADMAGIEQRIEAALARHYTSAPVTTAAATTAVAAAATTSTGVGVAHDSRVTATAAVSGGERPSPHKRPSRNHRK